MANENQYYKFTFAELGNFTVIPDQASGGNVDYESGFGPDYEKVDGEADRKLIERETFNGLMQGVTKNLKQWQERNYPTWIEDNGDGTPFTYIEGAVVDHNGFYWVATEDADIEPSDTATTWRKFKPNSTVEVDGEGGSVEVSLTKLKEVITRSVGTIGGGGTLTQDFDELQAALNKIDLLKPTLVVSSSGYTTNGDEPDNVVESSLTREHHNCTRYVVNNPFGTNVRFRAEAEIFVNGIWTPTIGGFAGDNDSTGLIAGYVRDEGLVIQTARNALANAAYLTLNLSGGTTATSSGAPCRVWCYRDIT